MDNPFSPSSDEYYIYLRGAEERLGDSAGYEQSAYRIPLDGDSNGAQYNPREVQDLAHHSWFENIEPQPSQSNDTQSSVDRSSQISYSHGYLSSSGYFPGLNYPGHNYMEHTYGQYSSSLPPRSLEDNRINGFFPNTYSPASCSTTMAGVLPSNSYEEQPEPLEVNGNRSPEIHQPSTPISPTVPHLAHRRYRCTIHGCNVSFKRRAELDRHKESVHQASSTPGHLCPIQGCNRATGDNGFTRKDNLRQHLKLKHDVKFPKGKRARRT